jgi:hypothetical protein
LCFHGRDAQRLLWIEEDKPLKDRKITLLEQRVSNLKSLVVSELPLAPHALHLTGVPLEVYRTAFEKEKVKRFTNTWKGFFTLSQRLYVLKQPR